MDEAAVDPIRQVAVGSKVAKGVGPFGEGKAITTFKTLGEVSAATISLSLVTNNRDLPTNTETTVNVPYISKAWYLSRRQVMALGGGTPFEESIVRSAGYRLVLKEDALILQGWQADGTNYNINGFYQGAGNSEATSDDFDTQGKALTEHGAVVKLMLADNVPPPYNVILNPVEFGALAASFYSTAAVLELDVYKRMIGGQLFISSAITAGTGLVLAQPTTGWFDIMVGTNVQQMVEEQSLADGDKGAALGVIFECLAPRIYQSNALCKMTTI